VACGTAAQARDVRAVDGVEHDMQEQRAQRVVVGLRAAGADAHLERVSVYEFGVGVQLPDGRRAVWDADGSDVLSATVIRDGVLVGYVPIVAGSAGLNDQATVKVIARTDYDAPHGQPRERALPLGPAKPTRRGLLARALEGFR